MPYANLSGLTARYGQHMLVDLTDRALPPTGQIDVDVVQAALEDTDALIDGYLAGRYALPLAEDAAAALDRRRGRGDLQAAHLGRAGQDRRRLSRPAEAPGGDRRRRRAPSGRMASSLQPRLPPAWSTPTATAT